MAGVYQLTAKKNIDSPLRASGSPNAKNLKKGETTLVVSSNGHDSIGYEELMGALLLNGFCTEEAESYWDGSAGNAFDIEKIKNDYDSSLHTKQWDAWKNRKDYSAKKADNSQSKESSEPSKPSKKKSSSSSSGFWNSSCGIFLGTITLILPIWWVLKVPYTMARAGYRAFVHILTWPFRLLFYCCNSTELFPEDLGAWPKYDFTCR